MRKVLLTAIFLISGIMSKAQNWQTVYPLDTNFYSAGKMLAYYTYLLDSNMLRTMWVDSVRAIGGDSAFFFFRGLRFGISCIDIASPSWLGAKMIRKPDGTEWYFNSRGDTILLKTNAPIGTSWILAKDLAGTIFKGTVTAITNQTIDGTPDSVKTISIQAMKGAAPVADWYNGMVFQISRSHGWIKTLDLYRFPDKLPRTTNVLLIPDSLQHERLPKRFSVMDVNHVDLLWRYAPGSETITLTNYGVDPRYGANLIALDDSVISASLLTPNKIAVTFFTKKYIDTFSASIFPFDPVETKIQSTYTHTDTIEVDTAAKTVKSFALYESKIAPMSTQPDSIHYNRYFVDTICSGKYSFEEGMHLGEAFRRSGNCWNYDYGLVRYNSVTNWIEDFGMRLKYMESHPVGDRSTRYSKMEVVYASLPGCTWGTKIQVVAPTAGLQPYRNTNSCSVFPNPAKDYVTISSNFYQGLLQATLRNISGQIIYHQSFSEQWLNIPTRNISSGLYFLEVAGKEVRQSFKVVVRH